MAKSLKIPFHEVELSTEEHTEFFEQLVFLRDDPIADISGFGYYAVSRKAHEMGVPVLLQGQGGDELFWGYEWVRKAAAQTLRKQARIHFGRWNGYEYLNSIKPTGLYPRDLWQWAKLGFGIPEALRSFYRDGSSNPDDIVFMDALSSFSEQKNDIYQYYTPDFFECVRAIGPESLYRFSKPWPNIPVTITSLITKTYLFENGIAQGDRLSMANSLELRLPLVDFRLVETVIGLRRNYPDQTLPAKHWFKEAVRDLIPEDILTRPKRGFHTPAEWHDQLGERYRRMIKDGILVQSGIISSSAGDFFSNASIPITEFSNSNMRFKILVLEIWARQMIKNSNIFSEYSFSRTRD